MCLIIHRSHFTQRCGMATFCFSNENTPALKNIIKKLMTIFQWFFLRKLKILLIPINWELKESSCLQMFFKIGVLGVLGLKAYLKFIKKRLQQWCFAAKFVNFFRKLFLTKHLQWLLSELISTFWSCINTCFIFVIHISMSLNKQCTGDKKHWNEI